MEKYEKIKKYLREKNIFFEKKHKKDLVRFIPFQQHNLIILYTGYHPFIKKDNPKKWSFLDIPINYYQNYCYYTIFDKDENILMPSIPTYPNANYEPTILDENNIILLKKDNENVYNYYHYKRKDGKFIEVGKIEKCSYINSMEIDNLLLINQNTLYDYHNEKYIYIPTDKLLTETYEISNLLKDWNVKNYNELQSLINKKIENNKLLCGYKMISYKRNNIQQTFYTIIFFDAQGNIVSNLFYQDNNEIVSVPVKKKNLAMVYDNLENQCKLRVEAIIKENKPTILENEIIKKLNL